MAAERPARQAPSLYSAGQHSMSPNLGVTPKLALAAEYFKARCACGRRELRVVGGQCQILHVSLAPHSKRGDQVQSIECTDDCRHRGGCGQTKLLAQRDNG